MPSSIRFPSEWDYETRGGAVYPESTGTDAHVYGAGSLDDAGSGDYGDLLHLF
jgi:hypothetical protein